MMNWKCSQEYLTQSPFPVQPSRCLSHSLQENRSLFGGEIELETPYPRTPKAISEEEERVALKRANDLKSKSSSYIKKKMVNILN